MITGGCHRRVQGLEVVQRDFGQLRGQRDVDVTGDVHGIKVGVVADQSGNLARKPSGEAMMFFTACSLGT
jgi:hypothetical protein